MMMISLVFTFFYFFVLCVYKTKKSQVYILTTFLCIKQKINYYFLFKI